MLSLFYTFIILLLSFYMVKKIDFNRLVSFFIIGFVLTGALQTLMIFSGYQDIYELGFIAERASSNKPQELNYEILLKSLFTWALYYMAMYIGFILGLRKKTINALYEIYIRRINKIGIDRYKVKIIKALVFFLILKIIIAMINIYYSNHFFDTLVQLFKYLIPMLIINLLLIFQYVKKNKHQLKAIIIAFILVTILTNIAGGARREIFVFIIPLTIIVLIFYKRKITFKKYFIGSSIMIILFIVSSVIKFIGKNIQTKSIDYNQLLPAIESIGLDNFLDMLISLTYARFNNMQALYWFYYDKMKGFTNSFSEINITFISLVNDFLPSFIVDFSYFREINGFPVEQWLFYQATGGNPFGGYAIPPMVESLWVFQNLFYALAMIVFLYYVIGLFFNIISRLMTPVLPMLIIILFETFINPESINQVYYNIFHGILFALIIQYFLMKKIKIL